LAQLRQDYVEFQKRNTEVIALGPDGPNAFKNYWANENLPFIGLADIKSKVASQYHQEVNWLKAGRMPAVLVIDLDGKIFCIQYGESMADIPTNDELFKILDTM
jgi:peroxiredoxin